MFGSIVVEGCWQCKQTEVVQEDARESTRH